MNKIVNLLKEINPFNSKDTNNEVLYLIKILLTTFIVYFISLIIGEVLIIGGSYLFGFNATDHQMPQDVVLLCSFYGYIITILLFLLFTKMINKKKISSIGLDKKFKTIFKGILIGITTLTIIIGILLLCGAIKYNGFNSNINIFIIILYFFGYFIQSSMEELISRGYLLHRLKEKLSIKTAVFVSIIFFTGGHFPQLFNEGLILGLIGVINLFLISLIFTVLTFKDKNIYSAIGFHFIWNFVLFNIIGLNLSGIEITNPLLKMKVVNSFLTGSSYGIESSIITMIVLFFIFIFLKRKVVIK